MNTNPTSAQRTNGSARSTVPKGTVPKGTVPKGTTAEANVARGKGNADGKADRRMVSTGNPRVTVAFPFSKIDIREPSEALRDLAVLVDKLAEQTAAIASQAAPDQAEAAVHLAAEAALLAHRLGSS
jgi:hypothetical protein